MHTASLPEQRLPSTDPRTETETCSCEARPTHETHGRSLPFRAPDVALAGPAAPSERASKQDVRRAGCAGSVARGAEGWAIQRLLRLSRGLLTWYSCAGRVVIRARLDGINEGPPPDPPGAGPVRPPPCLFRLPALLSAVKHHHPRTSAFSITERRRGTRCPSPARPMLPPWLQRHRSGGSGAATWASLPRILGPFNL